MSATLNKKMHLEREDAVPVIILMALVLSLGMHLTIYFLLEPMVFGGEVRPQGPRQYMVIVDVPGNGEESGEPAGDGSDVDNHDEAVPVSTSTAPTRAMRRVITSPEGEAPAILTAEPSDTSDTPSDEPPDVVAVRDESETPLEVPNPMELADQMFLEQLMARSRRSGLGGEGGGAGVGTGAGGGGDGCPDPIVGTWRARRYDTMLQRHAIFTIRVTERHGDRIEGTIINRAWSGGRSQRSPPRCGPGVWDHTVTMPATGRVRGTSFRFDGRSHRRVNHCMDVGLWMYNLDHFTGDLTRDTLNVVNNDGGHEINSPYRFRRISCE